MRIPEQVHRLAIVLAIVIGGTLLTRFVIIPRSLVSTELHWAQTTQREATRPLKFAGSTACQDCHEDVAAKKAKSFHRVLACEGCHTPSIKHAEDPSAAKPTVLRERKLCATCHAYDPSRPTGFPQINVTAHNPLKACVTCHNPHDPVPPKVPKECAACHAQIERAKAVSSHALLTCTTCHKAPERHKTAPRTALPSKPDSRDFCGACHGQGAAGAPKEAPKVDLSTHGARNLCWECHYPHLPEGRS
ncbi:MAG: hypothetical protein HYU25_01445 [Candidatus Rokubacteria bacterium]|nr:hypothetical protein [Candidatus Rokubacteria bacterium]